MAVTSSRSHAPTVLPRRFYLDSPPVVARKLLGKLVTHHLHGERLTGRIVEAEAYLGHADEASHMYRGQTARNAVLFGPAGFSYIYLIYGLHSCLNFSCGRRGEPGGVLIRALEPVAGVETMARLRGLSGPGRRRLLCSGPGRLCQALGITRSLDNGLDVTRGDSRLGVLDDGSPPPSILVTRRIGISKAADLPLRFLVTE